MASASDRLRVAFVAGTLGQGGAEKQLVYMAAALRDANVDIRVYSLTLGEFYESALQRVGVPPVWIGRFSNPLFRLAALARMMRRFQPDILQATHFFANLYVTIVGRFCGAIAIGSIRNDTLHELESNRFWGRWLLGAPPVLLANSCVARQNAEAFGVGADKIWVVPNVVDLSNFDLAMSRGETQAAAARRPRAIAVGRLVPAKRLDRFVSALALARRKVSDLKGILVGDGPEKPRLQRLAEEVGLLPDGLLFLGQRDDVPALLADADMLVMTSDHEGFPNVLLEAMAARLPVITTPAGDAGAVVRESTTGYVVPFDDIEGIAERMVRLAKSPDLCRRLGEAGRRIVEQEYSSAGLADRLLSLYSDVARR